MAAVVIGVDPAKCSHILEVIDGRERVLSTGRFDNTGAGYRAMRALPGVGRGGCGRWRARWGWVVIWPSGWSAMVSGCWMCRLTLSTRVRAMGTGHGGKNDPADAHAVAVVGLRTAGLREVHLDDQMVALRLLSARRRDLVRSRTQAVNRLHQVLMELIPAGARMDLTAAAAKALIATVRPRDVAGRTRRQVAVDLIDDVVVLEGKLTAIETRIAASGRRGRHHHHRHRRRRGDHRRSHPRRGRRRGPVRHPPDAFASYTGTAPLEVSSGEITRHRLSRAGNRRLNAALHIVAMANKRHDPRGEAYYAKKLAANKGKKGACDASSAGCPTSSSASSSPSRR
jgi:transposase